MSKNTTVQMTNQADTVPDALTEVIRAGARALLAEAVQAELEELLQAQRSRLDARGRRAVVRNGYLPERQVQTGIGSVSVSIPKVRDRSGSGIKFNSRVVPPYLRRSKNLNELIPWLYLRGISTGDMQTALTALLGAQAAGLSAGTVSRLKAKWQQNHRQWSQRSLRGKRYVYVWADGVYFNIRSEADRQCILVIIGVGADGKKELVAIEDGYRESETNWLEILQELKARGLEAGPRVAVGDGALGFWKALSKVYAQTRHQRCWVHKTVNVLNKLPKRVQAKAKAKLHEIWMAETRKEAERAFDVFLQCYQDKYPKAVQCLEKDRDSLLTFYDFPSVHWQHIRTTNPIESTFATVRLRTARTRGCVSRQSILSMVYQLGLSAEKGWRRLRGFRQLGEVIAGTRFVDGRCAADSSVDEMAA